MPYEEDQIAALVQGDAQAKTDDAARKERYTAEDAETAAKRARDDELAQGGIVARKARRLELQQAIKERDSGQPTTAAEVEILKAQIAEIQASMTPKPAATPEPEVKPAA